MSTPWIIGGRSCGRFLAILVASLVCTLGAWKNATAAELADQATSLKLVPASAAYYSASLRMKEQYKAFLKSNAYDKLMQIQLVQLAKGQIEYQWAQPSFPVLQKIKGYLDSDEGQDAIAVVKEMFADEIFAYGGEDITKWFNLAVELSSIQQSARQEAAENEEPFDQVMKRRVFEYLESQEDDYEVPTIVVGFQVKDAEKAQQQLDVVHGRLRDLLDKKQPEIAARLKRDQIAGREFLTLQLDGSMIPWDKLQEQTDEDVTPEDFEKWQKLVKDKSVAVALGVVENHVLLSIGASTDHLEKLGKGPLLAENEAIKRLEKHAGERVVSIAYLSKVIADSMASPQKTVNDLTNSVGEALEEAEVDEELRQQLIEDIQSADLSKYMPSPGETSTISFLTERGYEGYQYQTGTNPMMDSSKPLDILNHVGGSPLLCIASRSKDTVEDYDAAVAWLKKVAVDVEKIVESKAKPEQWEQYQEHRDEIISLLKRLDKANREYLYPALAQADGALVIDASAESKQWTSHMPKSPKNLPMLEVGLVTSVSDTEQFKQGVNEYFAVAKEALVLAHEISPDDVPDVKLPKPEKLDVSDGKVFAYSFPEEWGIDTQVAPTTGITTNTAVLAAMPATAERLLKSTPTTIDTSLDLKRPAALVTHVEIAKTIDRLRPWIDYGLGVAMGNIKKEKPADADDEDFEEDEPREPNPIAFQMGFVMPQFYQFLDAASALRSVTSITYEEDGVWVTHSETYIKDLED